MAPEEEGCFVGKNPGQHRRYRSLFRQETLNGVPFGKSGAKVTSFAAVSKEWTLFVAFLAHCFGIGLFSPKIWAHGGAIVQTF